MFTNINRTIQAFLKTKQLVALDIGDSCIKIVEMNFVSTKPTITQYAIVPVPPVSRDVKENPEDSSHVGTLLKSVFEKYAIKATECAIVISGGSVFSRKIRIPKLPAKELESGIKWEASNQIPFSLDTSYFDWQFLREVKLNDGAKNDEYMIAASSKKTIDDVLQVVQSLGLKVICVGIPIVSMFTLARNSSQCATQDNLALIDIGARRTNILILEKGQLLFSREIPIGNDHFNESIANEFVAEKWDISKVDEIRRAKNIFKLCLQEEHGVEDVATKRMVNIVKPLLERLFNEFKRSFDYYREQSAGAKVGKIILSGKGATFEEIDKLFGRAFAVPVEIMHLTDAVTIQKGLMQEKESIYLLELAVLIGLALGQEQQINFVPSNIKERKARIIQTVFASIIACIVSCAVMVLFFVMNVKVNELQSQIAKSNAQMDFIIPQIRTFNDKAREYWTDKQFMDDLRVRQILLANALKELSSVIPKSVSFFDMKLDQQGWLAISGVVCDDESMELSNEAVLTDFIIAIENSPFFAEVKLVSSERGDLFEVPHNVFSLACKIISRRDIKDI